MPSPASYDSCEFPWTLYFNGQAMPKWAAMWHWWDYQDALEQLRPSAFASDFTIQHVSWIQCRIDHVGVIESADAWQFKIATAVLLDALLRRKTTALERIGAAALANKTSDTATAIFDDIRDGLISMHRQVSLDNCAMWTNGYESDNERLIERLRRHRLPKEHPEYRDAPHVEAHVRFSKLDVRIARKSLTRLTHEETFLPKVSSAIQSFAKLTDTHD